MSLRRLCVGWDLAITEYDRQKLGSMLTPFSGSLIPIGRFQGYQEPYRLTVVQDFPICLCELIQLTLEP